MKIFENKGMIIASITLGLVLFLLAGSVSAADIVNVNFPCPGGGSCEPPTDIAGYLNSIYGFAVGIAGLLALGMIVAGGIYYTVSAGSGDRQREGKSMITSAILGVLLLFGSYLILRTVNPQITNLTVGLTDVQGNLIVTTTPTTGDALSQGGGSNNYCGDFASIPAWGFRQPGPHCDTRKLITPSKIELRSGGSIYYADSYNIEAGSIVWVYPYYPSDSDPLTTKACLVYAFREPANGSTGGGYGTTYGSTIEVKLEDNLRLCAPQEQRTDLTCGEWTYTAKASTQPITSSNKGQSIVYTVPVSSSFNYPSVSDPPPTVKTGGPIPNNPVCTDENPLKYCGERVWTCSKFGK